MEPSGHSQPTLMRREFFAALWQQRVVKWTVLGFAVLLAFAMFVTVRVVLSGQAWRNSILPILLFAGLVILFCGLTIAFGGLAQWLGETTMSTAIHVTYSLVSIGMLSTYCIARFRHSDNLLTAIFGLVGQFGLMLGVVWIVNILSRSHSSPHRTALVVTIAYCCIWIGTFLTQTRLHSIEHLVITVSLNLVVNVVVLLPLVYCLTRSGAEFVSAYRHGLTESREVAT